MDHDELQRRTAGLSAANVADGCVRLGLPVIFLEALERAEAGDVLVADNGGRLDEACIGDLAVIEAAAAGLAGVVI